MTFALAWLALACSEPEDAAEQVAATSLLAPDDVVVVGSSDIATGPRLSGSLEPTEKAVLRAETAGSMVDVKVELGDPVTKGQLLGRIDNAAAGSGYQSARSGLVSAEQDLQIATRERERVRTLVAAGALAPRDLELAESQVISANARLAAARAQVSAQGVQVDATVIKSPIAGVVSQRAVNDGDVVSPGTPLFTVIEPSSLRLEGSVPADSVASLHVGARVRFEVQGYGDRSFEGRIERVAPAVDPVSRQIPILVSIPNEDGALVAGLFAEGRVATDSKEGMVVPLDAVDTSGPRPFVLRVDDGVVTRVEVELGLRDDHAETVELVSGVTPGDVLLLGSARDVEPGTKVELQAAKAEG